MVKGEYVRMQRCKKLTGILVTAGMLFAMLPVSGVATATASASGDNTATSLTAGETDGSGEYDDNIRIVYIAQVLSSIRDAIDAGVDVKGYLYWSLLDNYEWYSFEPQFGMVGCDFKTFERTPKPSALFYRDMIEANGFDQDMLRKYLDHIPSLSLDGDR